MWWLMVVVTVACIVLFLTVSLGGYIGFLLVWLVCCLVPTPFVVFAIFARGDLQTFSIGALIPWVMFIIFQFPNTMSPLGGVLWLLPMSAVCGVVAAVCRRWLEASRRG
jgi:hypothetical protein